jgi:hypothetical protein
MLIFSHLFSVGENVFANALSIANVCQKQCRISMENHSLRKLPARSAVALLPAGRKAGYRHEHLPWQQLRP